MDSGLHDIAHLAWLAVWNRSLASKGKGKQREENAEEAEHEEDDASGLLCTCAGMENDDGELEAGVMARRIGLAQGLLDFTRSFARTNTDSNSTSPEQEVRVVQSANQKLVFLQPEKGYWIAAAFQPAKRNATNHSRESSSASTITSPTSGRPGVNVQEPVSKSRQHGNQTYIDLLQSAYSEYKLFNGTLAGNLERLGKAALQDSLQKFFGAWSKRILQLNSLGIPRLAVDYASKNRTDETALPYPHVIVHHRGVLQLPSGSDIPQADALAIASYLFPLLPPLQSASSVSKASHAVKHTKPKEHRIRRQPSTASWKTLGLGHVGSYMRIPSIPGLSTASTPTIPTAPDTANSPKDASKIAEGPDWMSISTFGMFGSKGKKPATSVQPDAPTREAVGTAENGAAKRTSAQTHEAEQIPLPASPVAESKPGSDTYDREDAAIHTVDDDLRQAIESELAVSVDSKAEEPSDSAKVQILSPRNVYLGEAAEPKEMVCILLDDLVMALLLDSPVHSDDIVNLASAKAYLAALSSEVSESLRTNSAETTIQHYFTSRSGDGVSIQDTAHSSTATEATKQTSASNAIEAMNAFARLGVQELFIRTNIAQWIAARFSQDGPHITLLPKSVGKEGSLLDAENELGRLHSQQSTVD